MSVPKPGPRSATKSKKSAPKRRFEWRVFDAVAFAGKPHNFIVVHAESETAVLEDIFKRFGIVPDRIEKVKKPVVRAEHLEHRPFATADMKKLARTLKESN